MNVEDKVWVILVVCELVDELGDECKCQIYDYGYCFSLDDSYINQELVLVVVVYFIYGMVYEFIKGMCVDLFLGFQFFLVFGCWLDGWYLVYFWLMIWWCILIKVVVLIMVEIVCFDCVQVKVVENGYGDG